MAYDLEEQEKIDQIKSWWNQYGNIVTTILTICAVLYLAYNAWNWYQDRHSKNALGYYDIVYSVSHGQVDDARMTEALRVLQSDYSSTFYASRASLLGAEYFVKNKNPDKAKANLEWIISNASEKELVPVAKLDLASIYADTKDFSKAKDLLSNPSKEYEALYKDRLADILIAEDKKS